MAERTIFRPVQPDKPLHPRRCETCADFQPPEGVSEMGICIANYPVVVPFPGPAGQMGAASVFPPMRADQRCGKWKTAVAGALRENVMEDPSIPY